MAIFQRGSLTGCQMKVGSEKIAIFDQISLHRVLSVMRPSGVVNTVPPDRGKLVTLIGGVCVQTRVRRALPYFYGH